jgi:hypothetical protein
MTATVNQTSGTRQPIFQGTTTGAPTFVAGQDYVVGDWLIDGPNADKWCVTAYNVTTGAGTAVKQGSLTAFGLHSGIVAASAAINTTETVLAKLALLPAATLKVGSIIKATLYGTCTNTNTDVSTFAIRAGILGTIADQIVASNTVTAGTNGTNVPFSVEIEHVVRTLGATGTSELGMKLLNGTTAATGLTGIAPYGITNQLSAGTNFATTTATFVEVTYLSAATTTTCTFQIANLSITP